MIKRSLRMEYGRHLVALAKKNLRIIALEADLKESTQSIQFEKVFPQRYIQVGIAEQNMAGIAAGLALAGKIPVAHSFACFISMRSCEQIRTSIAYPRLNVKFLASHGGISAGTAGPTHHAIEDIAIMRSIPNMVVLVPGDAEETKQALEQAIKYDGPVYIRLSAQETEDIYGAGNKFSIGRATLLRNGCDAAIITTGIMMGEGLKAADILLKDYGLRVRLLQMASIKPIDKKAIAKAVRDTKVIFTVEEHNIFGGLGGAVAEVAAEIGEGKVVRIGINDHFCSVGSFACLARQEGLTAEQIVRKVNSVLRKR